MLALHRVGRVARNGSALACLALFALPALGQEAVGSLRGVVYDKDFDSPLPGARVTLAETGAQVTTAEAGNYVFPRVPAGEYTLVFSKEGYDRQVTPRVVVTAGRLTDVDAWLTGEFTELEEFLVEDLRIEGGEAALLQERFDSAALMDSISSDTLSQAGASDAASALNLVPGATVQDGKYAVIRGLPDRYVVSLMNGVRLPTADEDKRAVELDQFPAAIIDSIQISKTFTPDQQGDASGGAVNVKLKGIPAETILQFKTQYSFNTNVDDDFLTYAGGGVNFWGKDDGDRDIPSDGVFGGAAGVEEGDAPTDYKWSMTAGGKNDLEDGLVFGGLASIFYERDSAFYDDGINDSRWVENPGQGMVPETLQGASTGGDFKTALFDVTQATESVQWGGLGTVGIASENHALNLTYLHTRIAEDTATLAEDTRGKDFFFPGYDPNDPTHVGNEAGTNQLVAPYNRLETLEYTERTTSTLQLNGQHLVPNDAFPSPPEVGWTVSRSSAKQFQPDKRQFGAYWFAESFIPANPPFSPLPTFTPEEHFAYKPAANFTLGNFQRIWEEIDEESEQYALDLKLPYEQWGGEEGYVKVGVFDDQLERNFDQDTFSNFGDPNNSFLAPFEDFWSAVFPSQGHAVTGALVDVDYRGNQEIAAGYGMVDLPLSAKLNAIAGARLESTEIEIENFPEPDATWFPPGAVQSTTLLPGDADVSFEQRDVLPSIGLVHATTEKLTLRASFSETVARQTFKELTPIQQQEFLGGDIFIGNPNLRMSGVQNYDLRADYTPYESGLLSLSLFHKDVENPIEYVRRVAASFSYTEPRNYPEGRLTGVEVEARQRLGHLWDPLEGFSVGANATFINSDVTLPDDEALQFDQANIQAPMSHRDMTNAPEHLYNLYTTYELEDTGTLAALYYTVRGDTLVTGAGVSTLGAFIPNVYETEYDTLNFSLTQKLGKYFKLQFQAKNLTDPHIEEVYRSDFIGGDVTKTSYTKGIEFAIGLSAEFIF